MSHPFLKDLEILASETAAANGFEVCCVSILTHLTPMTMQVQIRKIGGDDVSLDDCETFSSPMGEAIESANLLNFPYLLEISSPGISEKLVSDKDFQTFKGFPIQVIHQDKNNLEKRSEGLLNKRSDEHLHLNIKGKITRILRKNIIGVHLISPTG